MAQNSSRRRRPAVISEDDVIEGMKELPGYFDLTPNDFRLLYEKVHAVAHRRIMREYCAGDMMNSPVLCAEAADTVEKLINLLADRGFSGLPVVDGSGRVAGVVSEKDVLALLGLGNAGFMRIIAGGIGGGLNVPSETLNKKIGEIMSFPALTLKTDADLGQVFAIFEQKNINRVPVVWEDGSPAGIITRSDMIKALSVFI